MVDYNKLEVGSVYNFYTLSGDKFLGIVGMDKVTIYNLDSKVNLCYNIMDIKDVKVVRLSSGVRGKCNDLAKKLRKLVKLKALIDGSAINGRDGKFSAIYMDYTSLLGSLMLDLEEIRSKRVIKV